MDNIENVPPRMSETLKKATDLAAEIARKTRLNEDETKNLIIDVRSYVGMNTTEMSATLGRLQLEMANSLGEADGGAATRRQLFPRVQALTNVLEGTLDLASLTDTQLVIEENLLQARIKAISGGRESTEAEKVQQLIGPTLQLEFVTLEIGRRKKEQAAN